MATAAKFMALFAGLERAHGFYPKDLKQEESGKRVSTTEPKTKRAPVTLELWEKHVSGEQMLGIIPIRDDNTCVFGAIDIDAYQNFDPVTVVLLAQTHSLPLVVCRSKSGGAHCYLFAQTPVKATLMRKRLSEMAGLLGYGQAEIFPKQTSLLQDRGDIGGWINMPYFGGIRGMRYGIKPNNDAMDEEEFLTFAEGRKQPTEFFDKTVTSSAPGGKGRQKTIGEEVIADGPPCLQTLVTLGIGEGERNTTMFNIGVFVGKAYPHNWREALIDINKRFCNPPLDNLSSIVRSIEKDKYGYTCDKVPLSTHCNKALCCTRKFGVNTRGVTFPRLGELRKLDTAPPTWFWTIDEKDVELTTEQLQNPRLFQKRCMDMLNVMVVLPSAVVWQQIVNTAMANVVIIEAPADSSSHGQLWDMLEKFCTGRAQAQNIDEIHSGKPWTDDQGVTWFRISDLIQFLDRRHFKEFKVHQLAAVFTQRQMKYETKIVKGKPLDLWGVPEFRGLSSPLDVPKGVDEEAPF